MSKQFGVWIRRPDSQAGFGDYFLCAAESLGAPLSIQRLPTSTLRQDEMVKEMPACSCTATMSCKAKVLSVRPDAGGMGARLRERELRSLKYVRIFCRFVSQDSQNLIANLRSLSIA